MPFAREADFFGEVECHVNCGDQWLRVTEVGALMEVNPCERKIMFFAKLRRFENLFAGHAKFAIVLTGLSTSVMSGDGDAG